MGGHSHGHFLGAVAVFLLLFVAMTIGLFKSVVSHPWWYLSNHWLPIMLIVCGLYLGHVNRWRWSRR